MIPKENIEAIKIIIEKLNHHDINWVLIGSSNLALQGVDVLAKDIDILTDKEGALLIGEIFKEFIKEKIEYKESDKFKSYFGKFIINGVEVEVMGDLINIIPKGDVWTETMNFPKKIYYKLDNIDIPVISLDQEYEAYLKLGRNEKAQKIAEKIAQINS